MITHPLILIALASIAIPIAVHLFNFRRYRKVYFSNVDYLSELQSQTRKQNELLRWLILACRIMTIVCLVLAFAQPVIPGNGRQSKAGGTAVSIYLDNSYSMDNTNSDGTLLEMGRNKVREIVAAYDRNDQFQLVTNDADGSQFRWLSKDELLEELDNVRTSPNTMMMSEMSDRIYDFLRKSHAANQDCYVVSDFQKSTADLQHWKSDTLIHTTLVALNGTSTDNLYIDSLALNAPVYYQGNTLEATVRLRNTGSKDLEQVQVTLFANDRQRAIGTVDVPAEGHAEVALKMAVDEPGTIQCSVALTDYPITFDDKMYFSVNVNSRINVLHIGNDNIYLDRLLDGDSAIAYTKAAENRIDYQQLTDNNLIILDGLADVSSGLAQSLDEWMKAGGTLLTIPDDKVGSGYNAALALWHAPQLGTWVAKRAVVSSLDVDNPLYRNVFGSKSEDLELPTLQGHYKTTLGNGAVRTQIMTLADGSDYLTATPDGDGTLYLLTAPLTEQYTDWMRQAMFVPTIFNMALYSRRMGQPYYTLGEADAIPLCNSYELAHLKSADGKVDVVPDIRQSAGRSYIIPHGQVVTAGNYMLGDEKENEGVSFNYSRKESQMDCYTRGEVKSLIADNHLEDCSVVPNASKSMETYIRQQRDDHPLWRWFVIGALLFILAEILLVRKSRKPIADVES